MEDGKENSSGTIIPPITDASVAAVYDRFAPAERVSLLKLRALIFEEAAKIDAFGELIETLKWGQPAYLPSKTKVGTTIRLGLPKSGGFAMYTHCQTSLISDFSAQFGDEMSFEGNRGVLFQAGADVPTEPMRILIARALTYHMKE